VEEVIERFGSLAVVLKDEAADCSIVGFAGSRFCAGAWTRHFFRDCGESRGGGFPRYNRIEEDFGDLLCPCRLLNYFMSCDTVSIECFGSGCRRTGTHEPPTAFTEQRDTPPKDV
jgi:hypothetical protein